MIKKSRTLQALYGMVLTTSLISTFAQAEEIAPGNGMEHLTSQNFTEGAYSALVSSDSNYISSEYGQKISPQYTYIDIGVDTFDVAHMQSIARLKNDAAGNAYFLYAHSQSDGGFLWIVRVDKANVHGDKYNTDANGFVITGRPGHNEGTPVWGIRMNQHWWSSDPYLQSLNLDLDRPSPDGNNLNSYNHPTGIDCIVEKGICTIALQNFPASGLLHEGPKEGSGDAVGFLDVNALIDSQGVSPASWKGVYLVENLVKQGNGTSNLNDGGWWNAGGDNYNYVDESHIVDISANGKEQYLIAFGDGGHVYHFLSDKPYLSDDVAKSYPEQTDEQRGQKYIGFTSAGEGNYIRSDDGIYRITLSDDGGKRVTSQKMNFCSSTACSGLPDTNTVSINKGGSFNNYLVWSDNDLNRNDGLSAWEAGNCGKAGGVYVHPNTGQLAAYCAKLSLPHTSMTGGYQLFDFPKLKARDNKLYWGDTIEITGTNRDYHWIAAPGYTNQARHYQKSADLDITNVRATVFRIKCSTINGQTCQGPVKYGERFYLESVYTNELESLYFLDAGTDLGVDVNLTNPMKIWTHDMRCMHDTGKSSIYPSSAPKASGCYNDSITKFTLRIHSGPFWPQMTPY